MQRLGDLSGRAWLPPLDAARAPVRARRVRLERLADVPSCAAAGVLAEAEDDELAGLNRRHPDVDDQLAAVAHVGRVVLAVALHEERFLRRGAEEHPLAPDPGEEGP